jgi:hypothetical protein
MLCTETNLPVRYHERTVTDLNVATDMFPPLTLVVVSLKTTGIEDDLKIVKFLMDSSVGIATCYGLDGPVIESRRGRDFPNPSTQPSLQ